MAYILDARYNCGNTLKSLWTSNSRTLLGTVQSLGYAKLLLPCSSTLSTMFSLVLQVLRSPVGDGMRRFAYFAPEQVDEVVGLLREHAGRAKVVAGGTDLVVQMKDGARRPEAVINLSRLRDLRTFEEREDGLHIGALVTMGAVERSPLTHDRYPALVDSAKLIGSYQVRNLATIAGNTCNASPGADTPPALIALNVQVHTINSSGATRTIPIEDVFVGPGRTLLEGDEIMTEFVVPLPTANSGAYYLRHTPRKELDIAVVGAGAWVQLDGDTIVDARIALAAVAPVPLRVTAAEAAVIGKPATPETLAAAGVAAMGQAKPISDVRASGEFRSWLVEILTVRALDGAIGRARGAGPKVGWH